MSAEAGAAGMGRPPQSFAIGETPNVDASGKPSAPSAMSSAELQAVKTDTKAVWKGAETSATVLKALSFGAGFLIGFAVVAKVLATVLATLCSFIKK